ncbi:MAG: xanthine dehydrogenase family protein molybdopterin-binding subunit [Actinomycetota bacterium]
MSGLLGKPTKRIDGRAKVTGAATYAAEFPVKNAAHGYIVTSTIAKGKILAIDAKTAEKANGVLKVFTHENAPKLAFTDPKDKDNIGMDGKPFRPLQTNEIVFNLQPIALVVAETFEQARFAASLVKVNYQPETASTDFDKARITAVPARAKVEKPRGNPTEAFQNAPVKIEAEYEIPIEHHNPMEMHGAIAVWENGELTLFDKTQWVNNVKGHLASVFGIDPKKVKVISPFVGGAFGASLRPNYYPLLTALAARELNRPVKLNYTRRQMFTGHGYRPHTWQKVKISAEKNGKLTAIIHEAIGNTSTYENYTEDPASVSKSLYACPNVETIYKLAKLDLPTPLYMRAPGAVTGMFALECALDELAFELKIDPLELRLINYAEKDPDNGKPFSSKELRECYKQAAAKFGWAKRNPIPRSMRDGSFLVGWGMASGTWGAYQDPSLAKVILNVDGTVLIQAAASDMGPGTYTTIALIAADTLGLPLEKVKFELGNSEFPATPVHGGSMTTASVGTAVQNTAKTILKKLTAMADAPFKNAAEKDLVFENGKISLKSNPSLVVSLTDILRKNNLTKIEETGQGAPDKIRDNYSIASHGAQFVEVKVDEDFGTVKVSRVVEMTASGRIMNPLAAHSQEIGGAVWGIGMALMEATLIDHRYGRMMNNNLAGYHIPVNADIHDIHTGFVEENDTIVNALGIKGMGELGMVGVPAAIANAVFHATGKRIRKLPITPDKLI